MGRTKLLFIFVIRMMYSAMFGRIFREKFCLADIPGKVGDNHANGRKNHKIDHQTNTQILFRFNILCYQCHE